MRLYYTTTKGEGEIQNKPSNSLGGFRSSSPTPNSVNDNFFGEISMLTVQRGDISQFLGLVLLNETGTAATGVELWFEFPEGSFSNFKIAAVQLTTEGQMENVPNINSKPLMAQFTEANGEANSVGLGDLAEGVGIGIWIERTLNLETIKEEQGNVYKVDPADDRRFLPVELPKQEDIQIKIRWV